MWVLWQPLPDTGFAEDFPEPDTERVATFAGGFPKHTCIQYKVRQEQPLPDTGFAEDFPEPDTERVATFAGGFPKHNYV